MNDIHKTIIDYYDTCEIHYKRSWDLDNSMAIHYGFWDKNNNTLAKALRNENILLAHYAHINKSDLVLDAGCGVGGSAIFLAKEFGCKVVGITLSEKQVQTAKYNANKCGVAALADFKKEDFLCTTFPYNSYTVIWAIESLCHAPDKKAFLREAFRLLKNNSRIIIADGFLKEEELTYKEIKKMNNWLTAWGIPGLARINELENYLKECGFEKITFMDMTERIIPSSKHMFSMSVIVLPAAKVLEWLHFRKNIQTKHVIGALYQYLTLRSKLWTYGIFYAEKT